MFVITSQKDMISYLKININDYLYKTNYYKHTRQIYNSYLKEDSLVKVKIVYPDGHEYIINTPLLSKVEAMNILKILTHIPTEPEEKECGLLR